MDQSKLKEALRIFKELAKHAKSATDLHNEFFGIYGKFGEMFPTREERAEFFKSPEYEEIFRIRLEMRKRETEALRSAGLL